MAHRVIGVHSANHGGVSSREWRREFLLSQNVAPLGGFRPFILLQATAMFVKKSLLTAPITQTSAAAPVKARDENAECSKTKAAIRELNT